MFKFSGPDGRHSPKGEGGLPHDQIEACFDPTSKGLHLGPVEGSLRWENPLLVLWKGAHIAPGVGFGKERARNGAQ